MTKKQRAPTYLDRIPHTLRLWAPALIVIPALLALAHWAGGIARYLLFTHHLFWFLSALVLINPVIETLSPSESGNVGLRVRADQRAIGPAVTGHRGAALDTEGFHRQ